MWGSRRQIMGRDSAPIGADADLAAIITEDGQEMSVQSRGNSTCGETGVKIAASSEAPGGATAGVDLDEALARLLQVCLAIDC